MKNNKRFILAAGAAALGLVAATGVTSGFAWFATNATVTVNNLAIKAKSDNSYLLIGHGEVTAANLQSANTKTVDLEAAEVSKEPVHYIKADPTYNITEVETLGNWGTATSNSWESSTKAGDITALVSPAALSSYVLIEEFTVGLAENSAGIPAIEVSSVTLPANTGIGLILATANGGFLFNNTDAATLGTIAAGTKKFASSALANDEATLKVKAYVFVDGEDTHVFSKAAADLHGSVSFTLKTSAAA